MTKPSEFIENARKHGVGILGPQATVVPYTGVTGFMSPREVKSVAADAYTISGFDTPIYGHRKLAVGVLVSWKTLNGEAPGQPGRYPKIERVREILDAAAEPYHHRSPWQPETEGTVFDLKSKCLRMIHYNSRQEYLIPQINRLLEVVGPNVDGFQLNMTWPSGDDIRSLSQDYPTLRFVLQVNSSMYSNVSRSVQLLVNEIRKRYVPGITDILYDMSGGTGSPADKVEAVKTVEALYDAFGGAYAGDIGIGLAGGLHWQDLVWLTPLFERWPDLSIDAEGKLRDKNDALDTDLAREYIRRAAGTMPLQNL